jgi:hypothetical protein
MKIAIIIGISEHDNSTYNLSASRNDADFVFEAIQETGNYEDSLRISERLPSVKLKEKITDFIEKYKGQTIEEIFFYFSGHGNFDGTEFYFILSDYKENQPKQTSLENSELDNWLKSTNPKLVIKVVDACNAGIQYIKDPQAFKKYIDGANKSFGNCYFMFSSLNNQMSVANEKISLFTSSFLRSLTTNANAIIRYKDIIDFISDDFENNSSQTPYFLMQATNTEKFGGVSDTFKKKVEDFLNDRIYDNISNAGEPSKKNSLIDLVKNDASKYCSIEDLLARLETIKKQINEYKPNTEIDLLYDFKSNFLEEYNTYFKNLNQIGKWLYENESKYFAEVKFKNQAYTVEDPLDTISVLRGTERRKITKYKEVINGIELTQNIPYKAIETISSPKYENLEHKGLLILFIFSKTKMRFFYSFISFKEINWNEKRVREEIKWKTIECDLKDTDSILNEVKKIFELFEQFILEPLKQKFSDDANMQVSQSADSKTD